MDVESRTMRDTILETRSLPRSLAATRRGFAFYVADPLSSIHEFTPNHPMNELTVKLSQSLGRTTWWTWRLVCFCSIAVFITSAPAQTDSEVRDMVQQIDQLRDAGEFQEAVPIAQKVLKYCGKHDGPDHPETGDSLNDLASLSEGMGKYAKAIPLYERALKIREKVLGKEHQYTAIILNNLAEAYRESVDFAKAETLSKRALDTREKLFGPDHRATGESINNLAWVYLDGGNYAKAEPLFLRSLKITEQVLGPEHPDTATSLNNLGVLYQMMREFKK